MNGERSHMEILPELLDFQLLGVLGTQHEGEPYTSLVGFAATSDLKEILFTTGRSTRKLQNPEESPRPGQPKPGDRQLYLGQSPILSLEADDWRLQMQPVLVATGRYPGSGVARSISRQDPPPPARGPPVAGSLPV